MSDAVLLLKGQQYWHSRRRCKSKQCPKTQPSNAVAMFLVWKLAKVGLASNTTRKVNHWWCMLCCSTSRWYEHSYWSKFPFSCEHYDELNAWDHYVQYLDDAYDLDYLDAFFNEDAKEIDWIEDAAHALGYGPLVQCTTVANVSFQRIYCH